MKESVESFAFFLQAGSGSDVKPFRWFGLGGAILGKTIAFSPGLIQLKARCFVMIGIKPVIKRKTL